MYKFLVLTLAFFAAPGFSQYMDYGVSHPKLGEDTSSAGVGTYKLERLESGDFRMQLFDPAGKQLMRCSIDQRESEAYTLTCEYQEAHYRATYFPDSASFEDLGTGDYITVTFEVSEEEPRVYQPQPGDPLPEPPQPIVRGTKTLEEARKAWEPQITLIRVAYAEFQATLGLAPTAQQPQGATICPNGNDPTCGPTIIGPLSAHLYPNPTSCCSDLSASMDSRCRVLTGNTCCANTPCQTTCFLLCSCSLSGVLFSCPVCV